MMKKFKGLLLISILIIIATLFVACNNKKEDIIEVLPAETIHIKTAKDLLNARQYVGAKYKNYTLILDNDIDLTGEDWLPIGISYSQAFMGTFDGNDKSITNLTIKGWDEDGTPLYIAKRILGYKKDGTPVYMSNNIIDMTIKGDYIDEYTDVPEYEIVDKILYEGNNSDPNYIEIKDKEGTFETTNGYGSVGLFGFTVNANIKNLTIDSADISYYEDSETSYGGILTGFDSSSNINNITITNSNLSSSFIRKLRIGYSEKFATPVKKDYINNYVEYKGILTGYSKSSSINKNNYKAIVINGCNISNTNFSAYYDKGFRIFGKDENAILVKEKNPESTFFIMKNDDKSTMNILQKDDVAEKVFTGSIAGFGQNIIFDDCHVTDFNKSNIIGDNIFVLENPTYNSGRDMYFGGIVSYANDVDIKSSTCENVFFSTILYTGLNNVSSYLNNQLKGIVFDSANVGGIIGFGDNVKINDCDVVNNYFHICASDSVASVNVAGIAGYINNLSKIDTISVNNSYFYSSYTGTEKELGSCLAGVNSICNNSTILNCGVNNLYFDVRNNNKYIYTKAFVSKTLGQAYLSDANSNHIYFYNNPGNKSQRNEVNDCLFPVEQKSSYVIEDGNKVIRLYRFEDDEYSTNYVSVFGELIPRDSNKNIYKPKSLYINCNDELSSKYTKGQSIDVFNVYYLYIPETDSYASINADTQSEVRAFDNNKIYARLSDDYSFVISVDNKFNNNLTYYEYVKEQGKLSQTSDKVFDSNKTYYCKNSDIVINDYKLEISLYSKSNKVYEINDNKVIDNKLVYSVSPDKKKNNTTIFVNGTEYELCIAELYYEFYFDENIGFIIDENNFKLDKDTLGIDFSKYKIVTGRPYIDTDSITYGE